MQNGVKITHKDNRHLGNFPQFMQLAEKFFERHSIFNGLLTALLNNRPISQGVREGEPHLNQIGPRLSKVLNDGKRIIDFWISCSKINRQDVSLLFCKQLLDSVGHNAEYFW